jgi:hypothetical protein
MTSRIIKLNIGGFKFQTTHLTLTRCDNTFFTALLSEKLPSAKDDEGAYFIDRDGQYFPPILTWLRSGEIVFHDPITKDDVLREARFYCLQPLIDELFGTDKDDGEISDPLPCPPELSKYVESWWVRHQKNILAILKTLNKDGVMTASLQILPGHRQDFERPPQLLDNGRVIRLPVVSPLITMVGGAAHELHKRAHFQVQPSGKEIFRNFLPELI